MRGQLYGNAKVWTIIIILVLLSFVGLYIANRVGFYTEYIPYIVKGLLITTIASYLLLSTWTTIILSGCKKTISIVVVLLSLALVAFSILLVLQIF